MLSRRPLILFVLAFAVTLAANTQAVGQQEKVLHAFNNNGKDGRYPTAGLIFDAAGNLYGTTTYGGVGCDALGCGTVFELTPKAGGGWTENVLHKFGHGKDGYFPYAGLILDASGNLYGTTSAGGKYTHGTVFELSPNVGGGWTEEILHSFGKSARDGSAPYAGLIFDAKGNLYGTTTGGFGTVFELTPTADGRWRETILWQFDSNDGSGPQAGLIFDATGNLYGTTVIGGSHNQGTVFELTPTSGGGWTEKVLHSFPVARTDDGFYPYGGLTLDNAGNLYGTTKGGGAYQYFGTVFELMPQKYDGWTLLHSFHVPKTEDGYYPYAGLVFDASGNLYGTTYTGGDEKTCTGGCGTVFELTPTVGGGWTENVLHNFGPGKDGNYPYAGLIFDTSGNLYGTTTGGGDQSCGNGYGCGTVFEITLQ